MAKRTLQVTTGLTVIGLGAAGAVHGAWAWGSTWPRQTEDELADLVVGKRPMPPRAASAGVAAALSGAAVAVAIAGHSTSDRRLARVASLVAIITSRALRARGLGGLTMAAVGSSTTGEDAAEEFRRNDLRFYSPLCLALSVGAARAARRPLSQTR